MPLMQLTVLVPMVVDADLPHERETPATGLFLGLADDAVLGPLTIVQRAGGDLKTGFRVVPMTEHQQPAFADHVGERLAASLYFLTFCAKLLSMSDAASILSVTFTFGQSVGLFLQSSMLTLMTFSTPFGSMIPSFDR